MGKRTHGPYLVAAIEYNDVEKVSHILATKFRDKSKVKVFLTSEVRRLASEYIEVPLLLAATLPDPTIIRYFITKHDTNVNFVYEYGAPGQRRRKTALLVAVRRGMYVTVDALLAMNADPNVADHKLRTPLHHAVRRADYRMAKLLLARGALPIHSDVGGNTPLHVAAIFGHAEMCRLLLRHGADLYKKGSQGALPIHMAAREGHAALVRMFVTMYEVTVDIRVPCYGDKEQAPLHVACTEGHYETVFELVQHCGADVNARDSEGESPLHSTVVREYDPLGMRAKDDFTETVKILLNAGVEVNTRNGRGETPLHLAARNEFQKVVEVLILAGADPLAEDNDKNKPIDLVGDDDTVSKQALKAAAADRDRLLMEAREIRVKGFTTGLQRELPLSMRSQSTMNVPLLAGMHSQVAASRYTSHNALFQSSMTHAGSMQHLGIYPPVVQPPLAAHNMTFAGISNAGSGYIPGAPGMAHYAAIGVENQHQSGSSGSNSSRGRSIDTLRNIPGAAPLPRLPPSMMAGATSMAAIPGASGDRPTAALRKVKSVEDLVDQAPEANSSRSKTGGKRGAAARARKSSYPESEVSSMWAVTPPGSGGEMDAEVPSPRAKAAGSRNVLPVPAKQKKSKSAKLSEADEYKENVAVGTTKPPLQFISAKKAAEAATYNDGNESEDYFLDEDSSAEMLDEDERRPKKDKKSKHRHRNNEDHLYEELPAAKQPAAAYPVASARTANAKAVEPPHKKKVEAWFDQNAKILNEKNRSDGHEPVAHSTPPKNRKGHKKHRKRSSSSSSSSSHSTSETTSDSETSDSAQETGKKGKKGPPPPPSSGSKPRPPPPPKPSSKGGGTGPGGKPALSAPSPSPSQRPQQGGGSRQNTPLFQMEQPGIDKIIQLDVDESTETGETVISIKPLNPPGPARVQKVPAGFSGSTYVSLNRSGTPAELIPLDSSGKIKKPVPPKPPVKGESSESGRKKDDESRPVPKPRESKATPAATSSTSAKASKKHGSGSKHKSENHQQHNDSGSSTEFSDEDKEEAAAQAAVKSNASSRSTPNLSKTQLSPQPFDRVAPFTSRPTLQQQLSKSTTLAPSQKPNTSAPKLVFERVSSPDAPDSSSANITKTSLGGDTTSSSFQMLAVASSKQSARNAVGAQQKPTGNNPSAGSETDRGPSSIKRHSGKVVPEDDDVSDEDEFTDDDDDDQEGSDNDGQGQAKAVDVRKIKYTVADGQSLGFTLCGGNVLGVFVDNIDITSEPARNGLRSGDQLLYVNGRPMVGRTRDEVSQLLRAAMSSSDSTTLAVRHRPNLAKSAAAEGDRLTVKARFSYQSNVRGELAVQEGDVFAVTDTLPEGAVGFWKARKVDFASRRPGDDSGPIGNGGTSAEGLIPSRSKADQIILKRQLEQGKPAANQRGGTFFRSLRGRSKSVGRSGGDDEDSGYSGGNRNSLDADVVSYDRVIEKTSDFRRPVVILGLFCDYVIAMLLRDAPDKFESPTEKVENLKDSANPVDLRAIQSIPRDRHCLMIIAPPSIEYLQQKTKLNPIVIYISPVSKQIVQVVKMKLAPTYSKNAGFMFDEASRFEQRYSNLFTAVIPYTADDSWFYHIKNAINYIQNLPTWIEISLADFEATVAAETAKIAPPEREATSHALARVKAAGTNSGAVRPVSRTTDDLPKVRASQDLTNGTDNQDESTVALPKTATTGSKGTASTKPSKEANKQQPSSVVTGNGPSATRNEPEKSKPATVPEMKRLQSTSSIDQPPAHANSAAPVAAGPVRVRAVALTPSHETQL